MIRYKVASAIVLAILGTACDRTPRSDGLRDSFAQQLSSNRFVTDFQRNGDDLVFSGPGPNGGTARWRVHIDSAEVVPTGDERAPFKGTVLSSWSADGKRIEPSGRNSNLPNELAGNGLAQDCWALWNPAENKWGWE
jgi:hypothetical protein